MMILLLPALLVTLWAEAARCLEEGRGFQLRGNIRHFAVLNDTIYVASEEMLYQLSHDLTLVQSVTQRGVLTDAHNPLDAEFTRVSETDTWNATFSVNVLLPHVEDGNLTVCGVTDNGCGYCELLDLRNISNVVYRESIQVGSLWHSSESVSFLVSVKTRTRAETYILTAVQQYKISPTRTGCPSVLEAVNLINTNDNQVGQIFSPNSVDIVTPAISGVGDLDLEFVDGFQINSIMYLFSNVPSEDKSNKVRLLWLEAQGGKYKTLKSLRGATLRVSDGERGHKLISSSAIRDGPPGLWSGVFAVDGGQTNTELLLFDISPDLTAKPDTDPDFCSDCGGLKSRPKILNPKMVVFKQDYMTSVLAVRQKDWIVFFIGTEDGQLIKLAMDKNNQITCPKVLHKTRDDRKVFPRLHLDEVDLKHVYVPLQEQVHRVPVSKCCTYKTVQDCWSAQDPYCVWCSSKTSCTFEDDCRDSDWLSIPDEIQQKMVSYTLAQSSAGQITLNIQMHVTLGIRARSNFSCQASLGSGLDLKSTDQQFPLCTFVLDNTTLPTAGLPVELKVRFGMTQLLERLNLLNCTEFSGPPTSALCQKCIKAGCGWTTNGCSWSNQGDTLCQMMESWMNFSRPEIHSITPSVVSFYGRNHAVLKGRNLSAVTAVRIQTDMGCTPKEIPFWDNTGESLMFHIPSAESKGVVKVCVLLPDGSCHGNGGIAYKSAPSCSRISPNSSWMSGKRKITLMGSHLEFVEAFIHNKMPQEVQITQNNNHQTITYDSPAAKNTYGAFSSTLSLRVANETLACSTSLTYYPDPEFTTFSSTRTGDNIRITIQKKVDKLDISLAELSVWGIHEGKPNPCIMEEKATFDGTEFFNCEIKNTRTATIQELMIQYGDKTVTLNLSTHLYTVILICLLLIPNVIIALIVIICWIKQEKFAS